MAKYFDVFRLQTLLALALSLFILCPSHSYGADRSLATATATRWGEMMLAIGDISPLDRESRRRAAALIKRNCSWVADKVPRLSPREQEWLEAETNASSERFYATLNTSEFSRNFLVRWLTSCVADASAIAGGDENFSQWKEAAHWSNLATFFTQTDVAFHAKRLEQRGVIAIDKPEQDGIEAMQSSAATILRNFVTPLLLSEALTKR